LDYMFDSFRIARGLAGWFSVALSENGIDAFGSIKKIVIIFG